MSELREFLLQTTELKDLKIENEESIKTLTEENEKLTIDFKTEKDKNLVTEEKLAKVTQDYDELVELYTPQLEKEKMRQEKDK